MGVETIEREGVEVRVETGTGILELPDGATPQARNARVEIKATHTDLRYPVKAWVDTKDGFLWGAVVDAHQRRFEVEYRIETRPGRNAPAGKTLAELAAKDKIRDLVALKPVQGNTREPEPRQEPTSGPQEPATPSAPPPAPRQAPEPQEPKFGPEGEALNSAAADVLEDRERALAQGRELRQSAAADQVNGARMSTYAYMDTLALAGLAWDKVVEQGRGARVGEIKGLAKVLLRIADSAQAATFGRIDRADQSRPRVRGVLRTMLDTHPIPWEGDQEAIDRWRAEVLEDAITLLRLGLELLEN